MQWFGESWNAPVNETCDRARTPVGQYCFHCDKPIRKGDQGLLIPLADVKVVISYPWHIQCFLKAVGVGDPGKVMR